MSSPNISPISSTKFIAVATFTSSLKLVHPYARHNSLSIMQHHMLPIRPHPRTLDLNNDHPPPRPALSEASNLPYGQRRGRVLSQSIKNVDPEQPRSTIENIRPETSTVTTSTVSAALESLADLNLRPTKPPPFLHNGVFCPIQPQEQAFRKSPTEEQPF